MFVDDYGVALAAGYVDAADKERNLVVCVECVPDILCKSLGVGIGNFHFAGLAVEGGKRLGVFMISVDKVALSGNRILVTEEVTAVGSGVSVGALENGKSVASVLVKDTGDAGCPVGTIGLESALAEALCKNLASQNAVSDGVSLVAVGHNEIGTDLADGMIDYERGIHHLALIESLGADAVLGSLKNAVAAVFAAAHDEVDNNALAAVSGLAKHNAAAGIGMIIQYLKKVLHFLSPLPHVQLRGEEVSTQPAPLSDAEALREYHQEEPQRPSGI